MYSLYRAWFGDQGSTSTDPTSLDHAASVGLSPPDTLVRVGSDGEHQFIAHRSVLAAHSGYLKALLSTASTLASGNNGDSTGSNVVSLSVSSVGVEAFAPLLNYMYTGRLEVTLENIYSVLLATHLLHMPGALEQCRAALLRLRVPSSSSGVLRPVPSRVVGPPLCWPPPALYSTTTLPPLPNLSVPSSVCLSRMPTSTCHESRPTTTAHIAPKSSASPRPSTSQQRTGSTSPAETSCRDTEVVTPRDFRSPSPETSEERISVTDLEPRRSRQLQRNSGTEQIPTGPNIVIDIACCDGPVRFHRVLNADYTGNVTEDVARSTQRGDHHPDDEKSNGENDENACGKESEGSGASGRSYSPNESGNYTCGYCRHTFKSQYCYQKHARRHLHPTNEEGHATSNRRREVRLLDLNVQYYPCKICGSKFPSYYFVHKHRKLCHAGEENQNGNDKGSNNSPSNPQA